MVVKQIDLSVALQHEPCVLGLGYFDGVHAGHQKIFNKVKEVAKELGVKSAVFTFDQSIDKVLGKPFVGEITPLRHKLKLFEENNIDICYLFKFDKDIAGLEPEKFIDDILINLNIVCCVCGSDWRFGKFGKGDIEFLRNYFETKIVSFETINGEKISSTNIIKNIQEGNMENAEKVLTRPYTIIGEVIHGFGNGKQIGFPTANIDYTGYVLPKHGVYIVAVEVDGKTYKGLCNVGVHPTLNELNVPSVEVYILNFGGELYSRQIQIKFVSYYREEIKFANANMLIEQIKNDVLFN